MSGASYQCSLTQNSRLKILCDLSLRGAVINSVAEFSSIIFVDDNIVLRFQKVDHT